MSLKDKIANFLRNFDAFGETYTFRIKGSKSYDSPVGGLFCILFSIYSLFYIIYTFVSYISGENLTKEYELQYQSSPNISMLDHKYFSLAFCIRNSSDYEIDSFLNRNTQMNLNYKSSKFNNKRIESTGKTNLPLTSCSNIVNNKNSNSFSQHQNKYWQILNSTDMQGCSCLDFSTISNNLTLSSEFDGLISNNLEFALTISDNSDKSIVSDYIYNNNPVLYTYFPEYSAELDDANDPLRIKLRSEMQMLNSQKTTVTDIVLGLLTFSDYYSKVSDSK